MKTLLIITAMLFSSQALADKTTAMLTGGAAGYLMGSMGSKGGRATSQIEVQGVPYMCNARGPWCSDITGKKISIANACGKYGKFKAAGFVPVSEDKLIIICMPIAGS